ncbi:unnamed protein product [Polarella glacialis]|uniref:Uncharacterized protein n=1 Tax=Polarella glacialis TaxID=89957 RepID=A0A813GRW5_POLGL|nr:unnamed protein product [Polarella glacialis]
MMFQTCRRQSQGPFLITTSTQKAVRYRKRPAHAQKLLRNPMYKLSRQKKKTAPKDDDVSNVQTTITRSVPKYDNNNNHNNGNNNSNNNNNHNNKNSSSHQKRQQ